MIVVRYSPGPLRTVVAPGGAVILGDGASDTLAGALWTRLAEGGGLGGILEVLGDGRPLSDLPSFAVVLDEGAAWRLAVRGALTATVEAASGGITLDGTASSTWSERTVLGAQRVTIGEDAETAALPVNDGVVLAASVVVTALPRGTAVDPGSDEAVPAEPNPPAVPAEPVQPHRVAEVVAAVPPVASPPVPAVPPPLPPVPARPERPRAADPAAGDAPPTRSLPTAEPAAGQAPAALGDDIEDTLISEGRRALPVGDHDGETISLEEARALRASGQLPPVVPPLAPPPPVIAGRLRLSTGQLVLLDRTVVIGRRPRSTRASGADLPHLVAVDSPQQDISRNHLEIRVEGDAILATDLNTTNGTTLLRSGAEPLRLHPAEQTVVVPGDVLDLGDGVTVAIEALA